MKTKENTFVSKGFTFTIPTTYSEGYLPMPGEALALNTLITRRLREKILAGEIKSRSEAEAFINSDAALSPVFGEMEETETIDDL